MRKLRIYLTSFIISLLTFSLVVPALSVSAVNVFTGCGSAAASSTTVCKSVGKQGSNTGLDNNPLLRILKTIINVISYIIGIASVIVIIVAGLQMIISGDNPQTVATARNMVIYAVVGVVVAVLSQTIVQYVLKNVV